METRLPEGRLIMVQVPAEVNLWALKIPLGITAIQDNRKIPGTITIAQDKAVSQATIVLVHQAAVAARHHGVVVEAEDQLVAGVARQADAAVNQ